MSGQEGPTFSEIKCRQFGDLALTAIDEMNTLKMTRKFEGDGNTLVERKVAEFLRLKFSDIHAQGQLASKKEIERLTGELETAMKAITNLQNYALDNPPGLANEIEEAERLLSIAKIWVEPMSGEGPSLREACKSFHRDLDDWQSRRPK